MENKNSESISTAIDMTKKYEECKQNGHVWKISGFYKYNPHLWCSVCGWYLDQKEIKEKGLTEIFYNLLNTDNPEGYFI